MSRLHTGPWAGLGLVALLAGGAAAQPATGNAAPQGVLRVRAEHRSRVERLIDDFRPGGGDHTALSLRTLLAIELGPAGSFVGVELADARTYADASAPLNTTHVDPLDVLSAHVSVSRTGVARPGDRLTVRAGRLTKDFGSRRLIARNAFRNTINAFTGVELAWVGADRSGVELFAVVPVQRRPGTAAALADNALAWNRENTDALLWGLAGSTLARGWTLQAYLVGFHERDTPSTPTANRSLLTPGARLLRPARNGAFDFQLEVMAQLGTSRASAGPADVTELDHRAFSGHIAVGRRFDRPATPRAVLQYDFATGDGDPNDFVNGRFDPLFGARAFEFGPTGFYGAFARSNLGSVALRVEAAPHAYVEAMAAYRVGWLASARDAWTTAGLRDANGASGRSVGAQLDGRVRARAPSGWIVAELGAAALRRGGFARDAGGSEASAVYVYTQLTLTGVHP